MIKHGDGLTVSNPVLGPSVVDDSERKCDENVILRFGARIQKDGRSILLLVARGVKIQVPLKATDSKGPRANGLFERMAVRGALIIGNDPLLRCR